MFSRVSIRSFDLWGNCKDGFDCNNSFPVHNFETDFVGIEKKIESLVKLDADRFQSLPLTERGGRIHYHSSRCLHLDWSDDSHADIVCKSKGIIVGDVYIEAVG